MKLQAAQKLKKIFFSELLESKFVQEEVVRHVMQLIALILSLHLLYLIVVYQLNILLRVDLSEHCRTFWHLTLRN